LYTSYRIAQLRSELERTQSELDEARTFLREAVNLSRWVVPLDMMDEKSLHRLDSRTAELFETIMHERHIQWRLDGRSPSEGFDSPGFAAYILRKAQYNLRSVDPSTNRQVLLASFPEFCSDYNNRCLVFYRSGYVMFRFKIDERNGSVKEFVVGMTPQGVTALRPDFADIEASRALR